MHILKYNAYQRYGIFGTFTFSGDAEPFMETLSHAYSEGGVWLPIVRAGQVYPCVRGIHRLDDGVPFETFEIMGVPGHGGLLFHAGNFNKDSKGCTLCGEKVIRYDSNHDGKITRDDDEMITHSRKTFAAWMRRLEGVDSFMLQVL